MFEQFGQAALISITVNLIFLLIVWWALKALNFEKIIKDPKSPHGVALKLLITVALTQLVSNFFLDYLNWSKMLQYLL